MKKKKEVWGLGFERAHFDRSLALIQGLGLGVEGLGVERANFDWAPALARG